MEDYPLKELNEMEVTKLSDIEFKLMVIKMFKELTDNYKELRELHQHEKGNRNYQQEPRGNEEYNF